MQNNGNWWRHSGNGSLRKGPEAGLESIREFSCACPVCSALGLFFFLRSADWPSQWPYGPSLELLHNTVVLDACRDQVHHFVRTAIMKHRKLGGLNPRISLSHSSEAGSSKPRYPRVWFLLRAVKENLFHAPLQASGDCCLSVPWHKEASPPSLSSL